MVFSERLREGDTVGLVSPTLPIKEEERDGCVKLLGGVGYRVKLGACLENMYNSHNYLTGDTGARKEDINRILTGPWVKAVFRVQGRYDSSQIMKYLDFDLMKQNPKISVGHNDMANLRSAFQVFGNPITFRGPMVRFNMLKDFDIYTRPGLFVTLNMEGELEFHNPPDKKGFKAIQGGEAESILADGDISVLARACGTFYQLDTRDKILFLEGMGEGTASLDMYITRMEYAGVFEHTAGILLGNSTDCANDQYDDTHQIEESLHDRFGAFGLPMMCHIRSGYDEPMDTLPSDIVCHMDGGNRQLRPYRQLRQVQRKIQRYTRRRIL